MRRIFSVLVTATMLCSMASPSAAIETDEFVSTLFFHLCLMHLPNYEGANLALEAAGYEPVSFNGGVEYEFSHASNGVWGAFDTTEGSGNGGCSIFHESLSQTDTQQIGLDVARQYSNAEPVIWNYQGVPSGWVVPFDDKFLYIIYNEGGISSDIRNK